MTVSEPRTPRQSEGGVLDREAWFGARHRNGSEPTRLRLICLPQAGAGAAAFTPWRPHLPAGLEMLPVELPGRASRLGEPAVTTLEPLLDRLFAALRPELATPYALFGHSFGAVLAYELTRRIARQGLSAPRALVVSGSRAPHVPLDREPVSGREEAELVDWLRATGGLPEELLAFPEFLTDLLGAVRTDVAIAERYLLPRPVPVSCPLTALAGEQDEVVPAALVAPWTACTGGPAELVTVPGGHSFPQTHPEETVSAVLGALPAY